MAPIGSGTRPAPVAPRKKRGPRHAIHQRLQSTAQPTGSGKFDESKHPRQGGKFIRSGATDEPATAAARKIGVQQLTTEAIKEFQKKHGLQVDGIIGHQTAAALSGDQNAKDVQTGELTDEDLKAIVDMAKKPHAGSSGGHAGGKGKHQVHLPSISRSEFEKRAGDLLRQYPLPRSARPRKSEGTIEGVTPALFGAHVTKAIVEANSQPIILGDHAVEPVVTKAAARFDERKHPRGNDGKFISNDDVVDVQGVGHGRVTGVSGGNVRVKLDSGKTVTAAPDTINQSDNAPRTKTEVRVQARDHQKRLKELEREQAQASKETMQHSNNAAKLFTSNPNRYKEERQKADESAARVRAALDERDVILASLENGGPEPDATTATPTAVDGTPAVPDMMGALQELLSRLEPSTSTATKKHEPGSTVSFTRHGGYPNTGTVEEDHTDDEFPYVVVRLGNGTKVPVNLDEITG